MATIPPRIHTQKSPDAGRGLFASDAIPPGVEILRIDRPLASVLDSPHLKDTCSECNLWLPENLGSQSKRLKTCQGCKITRYCCKVGLFYSSLCCQKKHLLLSPLLLSVFLSVRLWLSWAAFSFLLPHFGKVSLVICGSVNCSMKIEQAYSLREPYTCNSKSRHSSNALVLSH